MREYKKIKAFQHADQLVVEIYELTRKFPKEELFGIVSQVRRAAVSCASNIVEGASRQHKKEYLQFLYMARGSVAEVDYLLHLSEKLGYIAKKDHEHVETMKEETAKTLSGLIRSVEKETKSFHGAVAVNV